MRLAVVLLAALQLVTGCAHAPSRPPSVVRDGPIVVRAALLTDAATQRRHLGQTLDPRVLASVVPLALTVENVGTRELVILPSDVVLETPAGERRWALDADALARAFSDMLGALRAPPLSRRIRLEDYPALQASFDVGTVICAATFFGCVVLVPPALVGAALEATRHVGDRMRNAEARGDVRALQRRDDALVTVDGIGLSPGQVVRGIVYFPRSPEDGLSSRPPALIVRATDRVTGNLAIVVRLDLAGPPAR